jgi:hypothetical protein
MRNFNADLIQTFNYGWGTQRSPGYCDPDGNPVHGQSVSFALKSMRELGWKRLGSCGDFEAICEARGFAVIWGRNCRGQRCRIITDGIREAITSTLLQHDSHVIRFRSYQRTYMEREYRRGGECLS